METIGIDLGGTKIAGILFKDGKIVKKQIVPTEAEKGKKQILDKIVNLISELGTNETEKAGVGIPGFLDKKGKLVYMPNIPCLKGTKLKKEIERRVKLPVLIENDAKCFALAEQRLGAAKGKKHVLGIIIGTGVGCGIIINEEIYRGANGGAGEVGQTKRMFANELINLEHIIAGPALKRKYEHHYGREIASFKFADKKSEAYKKVYSDFVSHAGLFFSNLINMFNPEMIVVGGGLSELDFYKEVNKIVKKTAIPELAKACQIVKNKLGPDAGAIGAAILADSQKNL